MREAWTGRLGEEHLLGLPKIEKKRGGEIPYIPYRQSFEMTKRLAAFDPSDPEPQFANDLHATIAEMLGLDNYELLRYYSALRTPLDIYHSVDAFFELDSGTGDTVKITIDLTFNPQKEQYKADIILFVDKNLDIEENRQGYLELINRSASEIASALKAALKIQQIKRERGIYNDR